MQRKQVNAKQPFLTPEIGAFLRHLRERKLGKSLDEAAIEYGVNASQVSRIESGTGGNPRFETRRNILATHNFESWDDLIQAAHAWQQPAPISAGLASDVDVLTTPNDAYGRLCQVIKRLDKRQGVKDWFLGALHGVDERKRHPARPDEEPASQQEFGRLLRNACNSVGQNRWRVQMVANLIHPDRVAKMEGLLNATTHAIGFELKFVMLERSLSMLSPCILGDEDAFIGVQDVSYYRVQSVIHVRGRPVNAWLRSHWEIIWGQAKWLRRATVLDQRVLDRIKAANGGDSDALNELRS